MDELFAAITARDQATVDRILADDPAAAASSSRRGHGSSVQLIGQRPLAVLVSSRQRVRSTTR